MLECTHNNGAMNLSVVEIYSIVVSVVNAFSLSLRSFNPNSNVSTVFIDPNLI